MKNGELLPRLILLVVLVGNAVGLWPELSVSRVDLNDNVSHFAMAERMTLPGENPLDSWSPEWSFGYPMLRVYQTLPHGLVAAGYMLLGKTVPLMTVFVWARFLAVLLLPLSFFVVARLIELGPRVATAAALLAPLISTPGLYGLEYGSYLWAGNGLFPQSVATHFLLLSLGFGYRAIGTGRRLQLAGSFLGLTFLCHFIYGYIGALSLGLLAVIPGWGPPRPLRIQRIGWLAVTAMLLAAIQLVPLFMDSNGINHSRWEPAWKWDSFGGVQVGRWLVTGELLDHGRLPVLTALAVVGALMALRSARVHGRMEPAEKFILWAAAAWILLFCGRPFWGRLLWLFAVPPDLQMHRLIGGVHVFLLLAAAMGLAGLWRALATRHLRVAVPVVTLLLLYPMLRERVQYLNNNATWGRKNLAAYVGAKAELDTAFVRLKNRGGRVYPGLAAGWGGKFKVGDVPFHAFLGVRHVPAVAFLYHSMALTGDLMVRFDEWNVDQYRLFGIRTVVAPTGIRTPVPTFWTPSEQIGRFQIYWVPETGYFDLVDVRAAITVSRETFYDVNDRWMSSDWVGRRDHLWLDWRGDAPASLPRLPPDGALAAPPVSADLPGVILNESQEQGVYQANVDAARPSYVLFKMTWHPNWKVYLDGVPVKAAMLSPGFLGVPVSAGRHHITCRYESGSLKVSVALVSLILIAILPRLRRRSI